MRLKNSTLFALIVCCIAGASLFFGYFFYKEEERLPLVKPDRAANDQQHNTSSAHYEPVPVNDQPKVSAIDAVASRQKIPQSGQSAAHDAHENEASSEMAEQPVPEQCADTACAAQVLAFLADPANDEAAKVAMAKTWLKPETKEETLSLLRLLKEAYDAQQHELRDRLRQMLAGADSSESAELLISVLNGDLPEFSLQELPEDLRYEIKKAISLNPDENTGKRLAEEFSYQRPEEALSAIQDVKRPDMIYELLAQESDQEKISGLVQSLQSYSDPRTLDVIMRLGEEKILTVDDAAKAAYNWADAHSEAFNQERCEAYLSEPEASPAQRAITAAALAAASDPAQAMAALQKAYDAEADQNLRLTYEESISRARSRMPAAAQ